MCTQILFSLKDQKDESFLIIEWAGSKAGQGRNFLRWGSNVKGTTKVFEKISQNQNINKSDYVVSKI